MGDTIGLMPERVRKMNARIKGWVNLRRTPVQDKKVAVIVYGFPPNVGAVSERGMGEKNAKRRGGETWF